MTDSSLNPPVIIGALGGSGTRVVAQFLLEAGVFLGDDLNEPLDNLTAVLLLNRRQSLLDRDAIFRALDLLRQYMTSSRPFSGADQDFLRALATEERQQHSREFLEDRLAHLLERRDERAPGRWGWKMPPSHIFLRDILQWSDTARYLHVRRHPLDMAYSSNRNQLRMWGPVMLGRDIADTPDEALRYWIESERRIDSARSEFGDRVHVITYEALCGDKRKTLNGILDFFELQNRDGLVETFERQISSAGSIGRYKLHHYTELDRVSLSRIERMGYQVG